MPSINHASNPVVVRPANVISPLETLAQLLDKLNQLASRSTPDHQNKRYGAIKAYQLPHSNLAVVCFTHHNGNLSYLVFDGGTEFFHFDGAAGFVVFDAVPDLTALSGTLLFNDLSDHHLVQLHRAIALVA